MAFGKKKITHPNPLLRAGFVSKIFFWWLKDIIKYEQTHSSAAEDLYDTTPEDLSDPLTFNLESTWTQEEKDAYKRSEKPSLWNVFMRIYFYDFLKLTAFPVVATVIQTAQPVLLHLMMSYFQTKITLTSEWPYLIATMFIFLLMLRTTFSWHGTFHLNRLGMHARTACTSLIYRKMIRLPSSTNQTSSINLLTNDAAKFELLFSHAPFIIIVPVQLFVVTYFIWKSVGLVATTIGVGVMICLTFPVQVVYSRMALTLRGKQTARTDNRVTLIGEIINGMKTIKMYVWETYLEELVFSARKLEIRNYVKISHLTSIVWSFTATSHRLCAFLIILTCVLQDIKISPDIILPVTLHLFNLRTNICVFFFAAVRSITDICVSMKRIQDFLLLQEAKPTIQSTEDGGNKEIVLIKDVTASWNGASILFKNFNLDIAPKNVYAIVGPVGSGKSSLLKLILGEFQPASGEILVYLRGMLSYASQEPWLFNDSVKENILFGEIYNKERYEKVVQACALSEDFEQFPDGDETLVGDRGGNLSGGQRARINLARAVYRNVDIYLFDDPLSAVDIHVAKTIMNDCINGLLMNKTRILVTHSIRQLDEMDQVIVLDQGRVTFRGSIKNLRENDQYEHHLVLDEVSLSQKINKKWQVMKLEIADKQIITNNRKAFEETNGLIANIKEKKSVYLSYMNAGHWYLLSLVTLTNVLFLMAVSTFDFGLGAWTMNYAFSENEININSTRLIEDSLERNPPFVKQTVAILGGLTLLAILTSIMKNFFIYKFALHASKNIHNDIFSQLMMATLQFFEANSAGKIMNRFSEDTGVMDNALPQALSDLINSMFHITALILAAIIANWWISISSIMSVVILVFIAKVYVRTIQQFKRLVGSARSPILSFAASSIAGAITIRACRAEDLVCKKFNFRLDRFTAAQFLAVASNPAFSLWIELVNLGLFTIIAYICILLKNDHTRDGFVGLSLMQVLSVMGMVAFMVRQIAEVFSHMTSIERILQFKELEQETVIEDEPSLKLPTSWPDNGEIIFEHLYLRYHIDSDPVLWDLTCAIKPASKIGIVGRTGAGKSSLISALFRFVKFDGYFSIDGVDIKTVDLHLLRSKMSIVPQEPILFRSSLRKNLDPSDKYDDAALWSALESVQLKNICDSLEFPIEKDGNNLSVGQRQLLCLARAIVNKNKILILDEATANIDSATDALIQATIRRRFKECTVLTIAHRLETVMDNDKILVMDCGRIAEYDHPFLLLQKPDSYFFKMVQQIGDSAMRQFMKIAKQAYENSEEYDE